MLSRVLTFLLVATAGVALAQEPVRIGVITSITGRFAEFGEQHRAGVQIALEDVNAAGGVNGAPVEVVWEDDTSEVNAALAAAERLVNQNVPLVMGAYSSSITNPLAQYFTRQQRPFLVFTSSDDAITRPGSDWVYRINQPSFAYAEILFDVFDHLNAENGAGYLETIVTVHGNGAFESAVADAVDELAAERGYRVLARQDYDQSGADFRPILNRFKSMNPDVVFMVSYAADSVALARQIQEQESCRYRCGSRIAPKQWLQGNCSDRHQSVVIRAGHSRKARAFGCGKGGAGFRNSQSAPRIARSGQPGQRAYRYGGK